MKIAEALLVAVVGVLSCGFAGGGEPLPEGKVLVLEREVVEFGSKPEAPADKGGQESPDADADRAAAPEMVERSRTGYVVKLAPGMLREYCTQTNLVTIVRYDLEKIWKVDPAKRSFREISFSEINNSAARARERLERRLPLIADGALRESLKNLLGVEGRTVPVIIKKTGAAESIAGEQCEELVASLDGRELFRAWVAPGNTAIADRRWLMLGSTLPPAVAGKLAAVKGLILKATFPLPDGRLEINTSRLYEDQFREGDFDDPETLGYKLLGTRKPDKTKAGKSAGKK